MNKDKLAKVLYELCNQLSINKQVTKNKSKLVNLLSENFPSIKDIAFDYLGSIAESAIYSYVVNVNNDPHPGTSRDRKAQSLVTTVKMQPEERAFVPVLEAFETLVSKGPTDWSIIIGNWSISITAKLSVKYSKRQMPIEVACNYWLNSTAMRGLITLISFCFRRMTNSEADACIETLLEHFQLNSNGFDWVIARLGGCFPFKIILQMLQYSHKKFATDFSYNFVSELGIIEYLAISHEQEVKSALKELLRDGLQPKKGLDVTIVPFLLALSNFSDILSQNLVNIFLEMYNEEFCNILVKKGPLWNSNTTFSAMQPSLNGIALKVKTNGANLLISASQLAEQFTWCKEFVELSLQEFEQIILNLQQSPLIDDVTTEQTKSMLWKSCLSTNIVEQQTAVRLLLLVSARHESVYYQTISQLLRQSYVLNSHGLGAIICMIGGQSGVITFPDIKPGLRIVLEDILFQEQFSHRQFTKSVDALNTFTNLNKLIKMQKGNNLQFARYQQLTNSLNDCVPKILQILEIILTKLSLHMDTTIATARDAANAIAETNKRKDKALRDVYASKRRKIENINENEAVIKMQVDDDDDENDNGEIFNDKLDSKANCLQEEETEEKENIIKWFVLAHKIIDLLNTLEIGSKTNILRTTEVFKLAILSVKYFFVSLTENTAIDRMVALQRACTLLQRQCSAWKTARVACLRELVEGALFYYGYLFGQYEETVADELEIPSNEMVLLQNQRQTLGPNANRTVLHAGVIGRGLKMGNFNGDNNCNAETQRSLLKALDACCMDTDKQKNVEGYSVISLLLVELVTTDVMYNGLPFPDEEFTKVTMERDMLIRRTFITSPVLWTILGFISTNRPALCFSSVLLRAICATCLHQWRAKNVNRYQNSQQNGELLDMTRKLLKMMAVGQLLPPPLSSLHIIIDYFESPEIALILKECVWNYLKDHIPSPALFQVDSNGRHWRNSALHKVPPQYVDVLRNLMQKRISKLGQYYHQMFIMPELNSNQNVIKIDDVAGGGGGVTILPQLNPIVAATSTTEALLCQVQQKEGVS